jgi:hypothetical protein
LLVTVNAPTSSAVTRRQLGWQPTGPGLVADLEAGHYFRTTGRHRRDGDRPRSPSGVDGGDGGSCRRRRGPQSALSLKTVADWYRDGAL